jgi:IPT/TIG domain
MHARRLPVGCADQRVGRTGTEAKDGGQQEMSGPQRDNQFTITDRAAREPSTGSPRRFTAVLGLLVGLAALIATFGAAGASAAECYSGNSRCPTEGSLQHLEDSGGGVMPTTRTNVVYWDPKGAPAFPAKYESAIKAFFKGLEHDNGTDQNFYSALTQYGLKYETHVGKAVNDKDPYPAENSECAARPSTPCVSGAQIQAELLSLIKGKKLPGQVLERGPLGSEGPTEAYVVLLPPGVSDCVENGRDHGCSSVQYCGFHYFALSSKGVSESVPYAVLTYLPGVKGCESPQHPNGLFDDEFPVLEHEFAEMITDPSGVGWLNSQQVEEEEVVDICQAGRWADPSVPFEEKMRWGSPVGTAPDGALYNQVIDGQDYYLQQVYSNATETCVQRLGLPPTVTKLSPAKGSIAGGKKVKITGLNFENPTVTSVSFGKLPAKEFTVTSPTSMTAVTPASTSTGVVEVKLTTSAGTNAATTTDQFTYETK